MLALCGIWNATPIIEKVTMAYLTVEHAFERRLRDSLRGGVNPLLITPSKDCLTALPAEILETIFSYLVNAFAAIPCATGRSWLEHQYHAIARLSQIDPGLDTQNHPFLNLAATNQRLRNVVESYAHYLLIQYSSITKFRDPAKPPKKPTVYRQLWIHFVRNKCVFCGKASQRCAIFQSLAHCCRACDAAQFPEKIPMTQALKRYRLKKNDLFAPELLYRDCSIKPLRHSVYLCAGVVTTMFFKPDVEERARAIWGDLVAEDGTVGKKRRLDEGEKAGLNMNESLKGKKQKTQ